MKETLKDATEKYKNYYEVNAFNDGVKWQAERMIQFINNEDNHTEGELGNSCIDIQSLIQFINKK